MGEIGARKMPPLGAGITRGANMIEIAPPAVDRTREDALGDGFDARVKGSLCAGHGSSL